MTRSNIVIPGPLVDLICDSLPSLEQLCASGWTPPKLLTVAAQGPISRANKARGGGRISYGMRRRLRARVHDSFAQMDFVKHLPTMNIKQPELFEFLVPLNILGPELTKLGINQTDIGVVGVATFTLKTNPVTCVIKWTDVPGTEISVIEWSKMRGQEAGSVH